MMKNLSKLVATIFGIIAPCRCWDLYLDRKGLLSSDGSEMPKIEQIQDNPIGKPFPQ